MHKALGSILSNDFFKVHCQSGKHRLVLSKMLKQKTGFTFPHFVHISSPSPWLRKIFPDDCSVDKKRSRKKVQLAVIIANSKAF
jgi:hypothetical protein